MPDPKQAAGTRAVELVEDGMVLGLGTGSTVHFALLRLAERIRVEGLTVRGVPTSRDTERKAGTLGIPVVGLDEVETLDLTIDGADEIDPRFDMIKGGGGALLREKVVASISRRTAIVVGRDKVVDRLGTTFRLPVEVVPFAVPTVTRGLERLGAEPELRRRDGAVFLTDNGNHILDCRFSGGIADAGHLEREIGRLPGAVESGLFIGLAHDLYVGDEDGGCEVRRRPQ